MTDLMNRTASITGSARRVPKGIALRYASLGANIALNYAGDQANAMTTLAEIQGYGVKSVPIRADVSRPMRKRRKAGLDPTEARRLWTSTEAPVEVAGAMTNLEAADHTGIFVPHGYPEHTVDLGEIRMNYAVAGDPSNPAMLLIPAQTESWWGYEQAMRLLADRYQVYPVDLRGQGRSTWTPGRYSLDIFGGDLVRFIDRVIGRPVVVCGLSSGGTVAAWLSAYAAPGQIRAAVYEDAPLFASQADPAVGPSIRQSVAPMFKLWHKWLGSQWSIGDFAGMQQASGREIPGWMLAALQRMAPAGTSGPPTAPPQDLLEYDPEWGDAFASGRATLNCDHDTMLRQVKVPVLFTHHFHHVDPDTGNLVGALTDQQVHRVRQLVEGAGNSFTYRAFPDMPHSMHGYDPATYVATVIAWLDSLNGCEISPEEIRVGFVAVNQPRLPQAAIPGRGPVPSVTQTSTRAVRKADPAGTASRSPKT